MANGLVHVMGIKRNYFMQSKGVNLASLQTRGSAFTSHSYFHNDTLLPTASTAVILTITTAIVLTSSSSGLVVTSTVEGLLIELAAVGNSSRSSSSSSPS